jgi:CD9 antigen
MEGCCKFTKYLFIFFNVLFFLIGAAALGIGIWAQVSETFTDQVRKLLVDFLQLDQVSVEKVFDADMIQNAAILIIIAGAIVMVIGFLGCCGGIRENQCLLVSFFLSLFIILGILVAGIVLVLQFPQVLDQRFEPVLKDMVEDWNKDPAVNKTIDFIQTELKCCGITGSSDYNSTVPTSCKDDGGNIYQVGCLKAFQNRIEKELKGNPWVVGGIGIGVLVLLVLGMILSCSLCCAIKNSDKSAV